jgi:hypothetical protein
MEISFAPWRYRKILKHDGGPIEKVDLRETYSSLPQRKFEAYATLTSALSRGISHGLYGHADGTGSASTRSLAIYRALSEALERWATYESFASASASDFGFDVDPTTSGVAAFPGWSPRSPRNFALQEAIERWSVCAWWEGLINHLPPEPVADSVWGLILNTPWNKTPVVILFGNKDGQRAYSFACGTSKKHATVRAMVELERNFEILTKGVDQERLNIFEKRLLYFASSTGQAAFARRMSAPFLRNLEKSPKLLVDRSIPGPWSTYAAVWRCLFEPISNEFIQPREDYFLF